MVRTASLALVGIAFGLAAAVLASAPTAVAAPVPTDYDPGMIMNNSYDENFTLAINITANMSERMLHYLNCSVADFDYMYVWLPAGMDLAINVETEDNIAFRTPIWLRSPEHMVLVMKEIRPQNGTNIFSVWYNTTTWIDGPYYLSLGGPGCATPPNYYNVTWSAAATGAISDNDNSIPSARAVTDGYTVTDSITETTDQADFFKIDATVSPPAFQFLQLSAYWFAYGGDGIRGFHLEVYNSTGIAQEFPATHTDWSQSAFANDTAYRLGNNTLRFPFTGTYYLRLWTDNNSGGYSMSFAISEYTPSPNIDFANATVIGDNFRDANISLNYSFEIGHYYKIFISSPRTLWVDAFSNQIDILVVLYNETATGSHLQQAFSSKFFNDAAVPKDHEWFNYTATASRLASSTGWFYILVKMNSDLPPNGLYTLNFWLNDFPVGSAQTQTVDEDLALTAFNAQSLFTDLDCTLDAADPDCTLTLAMLSGSDVNLTWDFSGSPLLTVTPALDWFGSECRMFQAWDAKGNNTTASLCVSVNAVNDAPHVVSPPAPLVRNMTEDTALTAVLIASWFADVDGDPLTLSVTGNDNLSVSIDANLGLADFTPELNFNGGNNLTFCAEDPSAALICWVVEFRVGAVNDAPEARGGLPSVTIVEDTAGTMNLDSVVIFGTAGPAFTDIDGDFLSYRVYNTEAQLTVEVLGPVLTIRPAADATGIFFFEVDAFDGFLASAKASLRVVVTGVNDAPTFAAYTPLSNPTIIEEASVPFTVTAADADGDTLDYQWFVNGVGQNNAVLPSYTYRSALTEERDRSVIVKISVSDGNGGTVEREWTVFITNKNQGPGSLVITSPAQGTFTVNDDITFSATAQDADNDTLTWTWYSDKVPTPIGNDQTITVKLPAGTHKITLFVSDGQATVETNKTVIVQAVSQDGGGNNTGLIVGAVVVLAAAGAGGFFLMRRRKVQGPPGSGE